MMFCSDVSNKSVCSSSIGVNFGCQEHPIGEGVRSSIDDNLARDGRENGSFIIMFEDFSIYIFVEA